MPTCSVNGIDLYYEVTGSGEPILFLHGLGSSTRDWEPQVLAFSDRYCCITVDIRGHGRSSKPPGPYSVALFAADVAGLLDRLNMKPVHVVGLSMGGMIAFQMTVDRPECVKSLVIVNSSPELVPRTLSDRLAIIQRAVLFRLFSMRKIGQVIGARLFPEPDQAELREQFAERWAENDKRAYMNATWALVGWSVMDRLGTIRCPVLVVASEQDYTPVSAKEAYVKHIPAAELVAVPNARHALPYERPEVFNTVLETFLKKVRQAPARQS